MIWKCARRSVVLAGETTHQPDGKTGLRPLEVQHGSEGRDSRRGITVNARQRVLSDQCGKTGRREDSELVSQWIMAGVSYE